MDTQREVYDRQTTEECVSPLQPVLLRLLGVLLLVGKDVNKEQTVIDSSLLVCKENKMALIGLYGHQNHLELLNDNEEIDCVFNYWCQQLTSDLDIVTVSLSSIFDS